MARKPNYQFERHERDRAKAAKAAEKARLKELAAQERTGSSDQPEPDPSPSDPES